MDFFEGYNYRINIVGADSSIIVDSNTGLIRGCIADTYGNIIVDTFNCTFRGTLVGNIIDKDLNIMFDTDKKEINVVSVNTEIIKGNLVNNLNEIIFDAFHSSLSNLDYINTKNLTAESINVETINLDFIKGNIVNDKNEIVFNFFHNTLTNLDTITADELFGNLTGDVTGSVFSEDSNIVLVDSVNKILSNGSIVIKNNSITVADNFNSLQIGSEFNAIQEIQANTNTFVVRGRGYDDSKFVLGTVSIEGARGTYETPESLQTGDYIGNYILTALHESEWTPKILITGQIDTPTIDNSFPGKLLFGLHDYKGNYTSKVSINSRHHLEAPIIKFMPFADAEARDAELPIGIVEAGMVIYLKNTNKLQINIDSTITGWIDLN